eukprot:GHVU01234858.1.p1 GENE.GHVU01234858.1~~GHVU01234858.1.p1  ORF type:complete len:310 (-),score=36.29 GHVU01234858.1:565-1494(-)
MILPGARQPLVAFSLVVLLFLTKEKMGKRKCTVTPEMLAAHPKYKKVRASEYDLQCSVCHGVFTVAYSGQKSITEHEESKKHKDAEKVLVRATRITGYTKNQFDAATTAVAAQEGVFAYHTAQHNHSFRSTACTSALISYLYEPRFASASTKTQAIIVKVLAPHVRELIGEALNKAATMTLLTDASNRNSRKLYPLIARVYVPGDGVKHHVMSVKDVKGTIAATRRQLSGGLNVGPSIILTILYNVIFLLFSFLFRLSIIPAGGTAAEFSEEIMGGVTKAGVKEKVVALSADNENVNFGARLEMMEKYQ